MKYYVKEQPFDGANAKTAFSKARLDAERICESAGFAGLELSWAGTDYAAAGPLRKLTGHWERRGDWARTLSGLGDGDTLFLQMPVLYNTVLLPGLLKKLRRRGVYVMALLHDLELVRMCVDGGYGRKRQLRMKLEEEGLLAQCDRLIVHNEKMRELLAARGVPAERMVCLEIFDYLMPEDTARAVEARPASDERALVVAGNLDPAKAGYVYSVPENVELELFGVNYAGSARENVRYHGAFPPDELPARLGGGFGLVWDGPSADTCAGVYGEYLRYNNPHKTSLYLASGIPVAIWEEAALADFVRREGVGITAPSVEAAAEKAKALTPEEYEVLRENAAQIGRRLRAGAYLRGAMERRAEP